MKNKLVISLAIGGVLSVLALYLAFRNVPLPNLMDYLKTINYLWVLPTPIIVVLTFVLRVVRWQIILKSTQSVPFWPAFHPLMIGFMMNCVLPGRIGELARPVLLKKERRIPLATGLATVAAERLFDIVVLIALFGAVFSTIRQAPDLHINFGSQSLDNHTLAAIAAGLIRLSIALLLIILLLTIAKVRNGISRMIHRIAGLPLFAHDRIHPLAEKASRLCIGIIDNFAQGLSMVANPGRLARCFLITVLIWALNVLSYYTMALGCPGIELGIWQWTTVMVIICFFIALPSVPGFWGLWEAGGVFALSLYGVNAQEAAGYTLVIHSIQLFPVILIGLLSALLTSVNIFRVRYADKAFEPTT